MTIFLRWLLTFTFIVSFSASAWCHDLTGLWTLKIENRSHRIVTTLTIEFTNQKALSCMSGDWMRVTVVSATTEDANFYPASEPLSFSIENNQLTIGRNEICDAYAMLSGALNDKAIHGEYYGLNLGGTVPLGFFTLRRKQ